MERTNPIHVVAAIFIREEKVLACRRAPHKSSHGLWEFPGGKVEEGEEPFAALEREIKEELNFTCYPIQSFDVSDTILGTEVIRLESIVCRFSNIPEITSTDHDLIVWCEHRNLQSLNWAAPDLPTVVRLLSLASLEKLKEDTF